jgi:hypothetical protein
MDQWQRVINGATDSEYACDQRKVCRHNSSNTPVIEAANCETIAFEVAKYSASNQKAGDDEENIHARETARA